jgi:uncharacterized protein YwgA
MDSVMLAGLVKRAYPDFNMSLFSNRLKIQKMIFLMRAYKLDLGYYFHLYLRGPYCGNLTRDAFRIEDWNNIKEVKFENPEDEANFEKFLTFYNKKKNEANWLELASTLLLLKELNKNASQQAMVDLCKDIKKDFVIWKINEVFEDLKNEGLV